MCSLPLTTYIVLVLFQWIIIVWQLPGSRLTTATVTTATSLPQFMVTHNASILGAEDTRNLRVLYRLYAPKSREYVLVAGLNHIYQFDAHELRPLTVRVIGPQNFSILCLDEHECGVCSISHSSWPKGYSPEFCGPRPTDNFVKAWATSTVSEADVPKHMPDLPDLPFNGAVINDDRIACEDALYVCYNVHQGYCERVRLNNVSLDAPWLSTSYNRFGQQTTRTLSGRVSVVSCDPILHAAIAIGAQYVYAATEPDILKPITLVAHDPLSARLRDFRMANPPTQWDTYVRLTDNSVTPLQYKMAFRYRTQPAAPSPDPTISVPAHIYFVLQQPNSAQFLRWQPRVARICEEDKHFYSYVELNLACYNCHPPDHEQKTLNALHTASRGQVGRILAHQLELSIADILQRLTRSQRETGATASSENTAATVPGPNDFHEVVTVAFAAQPVDPPVYWNAFVRGHGRQSLHYTRSSFYPDEDLGQTGAILLGGSSLSLFSMAHVDAQFTNVIRNCLDGRGTRGPPHFLRSTDRSYMGCVREEYLAGEPHYCPSKEPMNRFITGETAEDSLEAPSFLYLTKNVTGMVVTDVSVDFTVCVITTDDGWLLKYEVTAVNASRQLDAKQLAPAGKPLTGLSLDITGTVAFVTSVDKVFRVELSNCGAYRTCKACLQARDPYCGWCVAEGRCVRMDQCNVFQTSETESTGRGRSKRRRARKREPESVKPTDYCTGQHQPSYTMQPPTLSWLSYTRSVSVCPIIRQITPSGVQEPRSATTLTSGWGVPVNQHGVQSIVLLLFPDDTLANDPRFRVYALNSSTAPVPSSPSSSVDKTRRLVCAFRHAPESWMQSDALLSGSLSTSEIQQLLTGIQAGEPLAATEAQSVMHRNGSMEVHCKPPIISSFPPLPRRQASLPIVLSLDWFTPNGTGPGSYAPLAPGLFAVYDCAQFGDCRSCTQSRFRCAWCLLDDRCVPSPVPDLRRPGGELCSGIASGSDRANASGTSSSHGNSGPIMVNAGQAHECPRFRSKDGPITLMSGKALVVKFHVFNVKRPLQHFTCKEGCSGQRVIASYDPQESTVVCPNLEIDVSEHLNVLQRRAAQPGTDPEWTRAAAVNCSLDLYWHGHDAHSQEGHRMINEDDVKVEVYACSLLAQHCDECLGLPSRFGCGWCHRPPTASQSRGMCSTQQQCHQAENPTLAPSAQARNQRLQRWLQSDSVCPYPQILSIYPLNGTLTGRPMIHVRGYNLGRSVADLADRVQLEGPQSVACHVRPEQYYSSRSFKCQLDTAAHFTLPAHGRLKVVVSKENYQAFSPVFHFMAPRLLEVHPERGPLAGGTRLKLRGENLNIGSNRTVFLVPATEDADKQRVKLEGVDESTLSVPCAIESETPELIVCRTGALPTPLITTVQRELGRSARSAAIHGGGSHDPALSAVDHVPQPSAPSLLVPMSLVLMHDSTPTYPIRPFTFIYSPNPQIRTVLRQNVLASGGTTIRADGDFLFVVESPRVLVYYDGSEFTSPCSYLSGALECLSPRLKPVIPTLSVNRGSASLAPVSTTNASSPPLLHHHPTSDHAQGVSYLTRDEANCLETTERSTMPPNQLEVLPEYLKPAILLSLSKQPTDQWPIDLVYGFVMDNVTELRAHGLIRVHPDPFVTPFPDGIRVEQLDDMLVPLDFDPELSDSSVGSVRSQRQAVVGDQLGHAVIGDRADSEAKPDGAASESDGARAPRVHHQLLRLFGQFQSLVQAPELQSPDELVVRIGASQRCAVSSVIDTEIRCDLDRDQLVTTEEYPVEVQFGRYLVYRPGRVRFVSLGQTALRNQLIIILTGIVTFIVLVALIAFAIWRRFNRHQRNYQAKLDQKYAEHESRVVRVFREDFMELQTNMQEFSQEVKKHNLPYRDYRTFCLFSLFPEYHCELMVPMDPHSCGLRIDRDAVHSSSPDVYSSAAAGAGDLPPSIPPHPLLSPFTVPAESHDVASKGISLFHALICNRQFLCLCIRVIEQDEHTTARDKSRIASLLCAALQPKMVYLTRVMCDLMDDMLERLHSKGDNRLPTAFRRAESVVDKMVSNWLSFLLYNFIKNNVGENLFYFYRALLQQLNMGPRDAVTGKARYTLDSSTLLQTELTGHPINLLVADPQSLFNLSAEHVTVRVLDCDTISQAKEKILDAIYKNRPYSLQMKSVQLDLKKLTNTRPSGANSVTSSSYAGQILCDWDVSIRPDANNHGNEKPPYRLNCVRDYGLVDDDRVALVICEHDRLKPLPMSPVSSRGGSTFRSRKSQSAQAQTGVCGTNLPGAVSADPTVFNSEAMTLTGRVGPSDTSQATSNFGDYANPRSVFSEQHEDLYATHAPLALPAMHALRPTGSPDPALWYHLEWTGPSASGSGLLLGSTGNGTVVHHGSPHLGMPRSCSRKKLVPSTCTDCGSRTRCNCTDTPDEVAFRNPSTNRTRTNTWTFRRRRRQRSPSNRLASPRTDPRNDCSGDAVVRHPLLNFTYPSDAHTVAVGGPFTGRIRSKKKTRGKLADGRLKLTQTSSSFDRLMESLPKEVFFNRLVMTRLSVTKYMDQLFESIFSSVVQSQSVPSPIKYLFDFLDARAVRLGVQDPKTVHAWKSNCLQMRFWNQLITNLDYIFDIPLVRHTAFERSFHAFSQAMTYACAPTREKVTSESSYVKLLFAPDIRNQWTRVQNYFREIKALPEVKCEDMQEMLQQHSMHHTNEFNVSWAIYELYTKYVKPCHEKLVNQLQQEVLKPAYAFKSDQSVMGVDKEASMLQDSLTVSAADGFEFTDWNPIQMIHTLNEVKRCMDQAQASAGTGVSWYARDQSCGSANGAPRSPRSPRGAAGMPHLYPSPSLPSAHHHYRHQHHTHRNANSTARGFHPAYMSRPQVSGACSSSGFLSAAGQPGAAPVSSVLSTSNTVYPDTLRSFNTLTTEFAADDSCRMMQQQQQQQQQQLPPQTTVAHQPHVVQPYYHHCYHIYGTHSPSESQAFIHPEFISSSIVSPATTAAAEHVTADPARDLCELPEPPDSSCTAWNHPAPS